MSDDPTSGSILESVLIAAERSDQAMIAKIENWEETLREHTRALQDRNAIDKAMMDREQRVKSESREKVDTIVNSKWFGTVVIIIALVVSVAAAKSCGVIVSVDTPLGSVTQETDHDTKEKATDVYSP